MTKNNIYSEIIKNSSDFMKGLYLQCERARGS